MTPETLHKYAKRFATRHEKAGKGTVCPTLRQCARRFRTTVAEVEEMAECGENLDLLVGMAIPMGGASCELPHSQWMVEAY